MKRKTRVLSITNIIPEYRIPVYNLLSDFFDITVAHHGEFISSSLTRFNQVSLTPLRVGPFIILKEDIIKLANQFDAVIAIGDLHYLSLLKLCLIRKRKFALLYWSIGVSSSYKKHFDRDKRYDKILFFIMKKADALIFYSSYPINRYINDGGFDRNKLFIAHNTIHVIDKIDIPKKKSHFLFVGTLYKEKKIFELLYAYKIAYERNNCISPLLIIGNGDEFNRIEKWVIINDLTHKVTLLGAIYDQKDLQNYYKHAIACISPGQAGLTVLNSMAYGVPFITRKDAITGGEIFNITDGVNGLIYNDNSCKLSDLVLYLFSNEEIVYNLSKNAQDFYFSNRTMDIMINGIEEAINYAITTKKR